MTKPHRLWRVVCSCGYEREATSAWAATAIFRLHVKMILGARQEEHTVAIEEPPADGPPSGQLPLV
ncbi:MAG TPA: hypothetical protein VF197_07700 [Methylomirabilota bacterium]